jgi:hypothetical protein
VRGADGRCVDEEDMVTADCGVKVVVQLARGIRGENRARGRFDAPGLQCGSSEIALGYLHSGDSE